MRVAMEKLDDCFIAACEKWQHLCVITINQLSHQMTIVGLIEKLTNNNLNVYKPSYLKFLAHFFIKSDSFIRQDKITALELIGATLIFHSLPSLGLQCWRAAMTLRYSPPEGELLIPKIPIVLVPSEASCVVFGSAVEVMSMEELRLLEENFKRICFSVTPADTLLTCAKRMKIQALLALRRICSQANPGKPNSMYLKSLLKFGLAGFHERLIDRRCFVNSCLLILEEMNEYDPTTISSYTFNVFLEALHQMSDFFYNTLKEPVGYPGKEELSFANLLAPSKIISTIGKFFTETKMQMAPIPLNESGQNFDISEIVCRLLSVLEFTQMTNQENEQLEHYFRNHIRNFQNERRNLPRTVLHVAVDNCDFEKLVKLILKLGADPNVIDKYGRTPLHILSENQQLDSDEDVPLFQALVDAGGHLDMAAYNGNTVISALKKNIYQSQLNDRSFIAHTYFQSLIKTVFPLSCYCARVIRRNGIRFDEDRLPLHLQEFVSRHSDKPIRC